MIFRFCFILMSLILIATVGSGCRTSGGDTFDLTLKETGETLNLKPGDTVRITLKGNPSTGYSWNEEGTPDSDVIRLLSKKFLPLTREKNISGAPCNQEFLYKAVGSGETGIKLSYKRPWEKQLPAKTFQIRIVIYPDKSFMDRFDRSKEPLRRVDSKGRVVPPLHEGIRR